VASVRDLSKCSAGRGASYAFFAWNVTQRVRSSWKQRVVIHRDRATHPTLNQ